MQIFSNYKILSEAEMNERVQQLCNIQLTGDQLQAAYRQILSFIDLTTLEGSDNTAKIQGLCMAATSFQNAGRNIANPAAVCVYPPFVSLCKEMLKDSGISVAAVAGAFPSGQSPLHLKVEEVKYTVAQGADEIDMVISRGKFLEGDYDTVSHEIKKIKEACGEAHLKVILETGELLSFENIRKASEIAILAGADFIKTSTGKIPAAASPQAAIIMCDTIAEYHSSTGKQIGFKPAGGIGEPADALKYYLIVKNILGDAWLNKNLFRIGASRLAGKLRDLIE